VFGVNPLSTDNSILIDGQIITDRGNLITDNDDLITDNELEIGSDMNDAFGRFITSKLPYPYVDNLDCLSPILRQQLEDASALARKKKGFQTK
jgi:hypothetical protein